MLPMSQKCHKSVSELFQYFYSSNKCQIKIELKLLANMSMYVYDYWFMGSRTKRRWTKYRRKNCRRDQKVDFVRFCPICVLKYFLRLYFVRLCFVHLHFVLEPIYALIFVPIGICWKVQTLLDIAHYFRKKVIFWTWHMPRYRA